MTIYGCERAVQISRSLNVNVNINIANSKRPLGRPNTTTRQFTLKHIRKFIPQVDNKGSFSKWVFIPNDELA